MHGNFNPIGFLSRLFSVNNRQVYQAARITDGIKNKSLSPEETVLLLGNGAKIKVAEKAFRFDGLSDMERHNLQSGLNQQSRLIFALKHNVEPCS